MRRFSILFYVYCAFAAFAAIVLIAMNFRLYSSVRPATSDLISQLAHLRTELDQGAGKEMQKLFPEGAMFTYVMYGLSCAETAGALPDTSSLRKQLTAEARRALAAVESPEIQIIFPTDISPSRGIFYTGWTTLLRGSILEVTPVAERPQQEVDRLLDECTRIEQALYASSTPWLSSYRNCSWPADNIAAMAALCVHDRVFSPRYKELVANWLGDIRQKMGNAVLLPHSVDATTGDTGETPRGCSQSLMIRLLTEIDPTLAREQYAVYRQQFTGSVLGLPGIREYPAGTDGTGDVDSGPVVFGIGSSSTIVGLGTALSVGDLAFAEPLEQMIEMLGLPLTTGGEKYYIGGVLPVADAFLAWSKSAHLHATPSDHRFVPAVPWWWRTPTHVISLLVLIVVCLPLFPALRRRRNSSTEATSPAGHSL